MTRWANGCWLGFNRCRSLPRAARRSAARRAKGRVLCRRTSTAARLAHVALRGQCGAVQPPRAADSNVVVPDLHPAVASRILFESLQPRLYVRQREDVHFGVRMGIRSSVYCVVSVALVAVVASGCPLITSSDCVSIGVPGIQISVLDKRTNQIPSGTVVTVTDGDYRETLTLSGRVYVGAAERPGAYSIVVEAPGYARWTRENVSVVRSGSCKYLQPVTLTSELQPNG